MATRLVQVTSFAMLIGVSLWGAIVAATVIDYVVHAEQYRFGTEVGAWRYVSSTRYLGTAIVELVCVASSIWCAAMTKKNALWLGAQLSTVLALLALATL